MKSKRGVLDRIKDAESEQEIEQLLTEGEAFEGASDDTRNRWKKAAKIRKQEVSES